MKTHHYIAIAIRIVAIFMLINSLIGGVLISSEAIIDRESVLNMPFLTNSLFTGALAIIMFSKLPIVIAKILTPPEANLKPEPLHPAQILSMTITVISIFLLFNSLRYLLNWIPQLLLPIEFYDSTGKRFTIATVVTQAIQIIIYPILIIKSRQISRWILKSHL